MKRFTGALCIAIACVLVSTGIGLTQSALSSAVTVRADQQVYQVSSAARTVGELLVDVGVTLGDLDRTSPSLATPLRDGMEVRVERIGRRRIVEETKIAAQTVLLPAPDMRVGSSRTISQGRDGLVRRVVEVWEKDGQVTRRKTVSEKVVVRAADTVILRSSQGLSSRGGDWHRRMRMEATAYDPGPRSCGKYADGYTANGTKAEKGVAAVDTRVIPFGTKMYIPGYGFAVAADRGSAIKGNRIDLCFDTYAEAIRFGRRVVDVYILR